MYPLDPLAGTFLPRNGPDDPTRSDQHAYLLPGGFQVPMSTLDVRIKTIDEIKPHPAADRLELATIGGWQVVIPKGEMVVGQPIVYFPPDTELPQEWTDRFGVTKYCSPVKSSPHGPNRYRIRQAKLRGEPSFGLVIGLTNGLLLSPNERQERQKVAVGEDVADYFEATKYEPPVKSQAGDAAPEHPLFVRYTEIENLRNYPNLLLPGERVVVTEKLHGTNCRVGRIATLSPEQDPINLENEFMAGSKGLRRKDPGITVWKDHTYWYPLSLPPVRELLYHLTVEEHHRQVILFGEVYGEGIQKLDYGTPRGFRAFDLYVDGYYLDAWLFRTLCENYGVEMVPLLGIFHWDEVHPGLEMVRAMAAGRAFSGNHIKEGVVVRPEKERTDPEVGRVVLKYLSDDYLLGNFEDFTDR